MPTCRVKGCQQPVSKPGHELCLEHWKAERAGKLSRCDRCGARHTSDARFCATCAKIAPADDDAPAGQLSSTKLGERFGISSVRMNLVLAELGWIEKYVKGWVPTDRGNALGANVKQMKNGTPYVVWPATVVNNTALLESIGQQNGTPSKPPRTPARQADDFRDKFPPTFRAQDGHMVRSRAEVLIDNWLYMQGIVHAYERRLPIEEDCYCDFYLPRSRTGSGKDVYIEFWGREKDAKYRERMAVKKAIYTGHRLRLIELGDAEIERLDDVLPRLLLKFGIETA